MNTRTPRIASIASMTIAVAIGGGATFAHANFTPPAGQPVGAKVYLQAWNPLTPDQDGPKAAFSSADGISSSMNKGWNAAREFHSDPTQADPNKPRSLRAILEQGDLIAKGITLRFLRFNLNPLGPIDLQSNGPNSVRIHWQIPDSYFDFKSTTPDVKGLGAPSDADPEFSFRFNLDITLGAVISDQAGANLITITDVHVVPSALNFDSHNVSGDAVKTAADAVSAFMKGQNFNSLLNSVFANQDLASKDVNRSVGVQDFVNKQLEPLNQQIARSGITQYLRVGLYVRRNASAQMLALLFGVKSLPLPPQNANVAGTLHFAPKPNGEGPAIPASCDNVVAGNWLEVNVQTGPRPLLDVNPFNDSFSYGVAPVSTLQNVKFSGGPVAGGDCSYRMTGLATAWSNQISFAPPRSPSNGNDAAAAAYWDIRSKAGLNPLTTCPANADPYSAVKGASFQQLAGAKPAGVNWGDSALPAATVPLKTGTTRLSVRNTAGLRSETGGFAASAASGSALGAAGSESCTNDYDLIARSALDVNQGRILGKARFVQPGDAVQNQAVQRSWGERQAVNQASAASVQSQRLHSMKQQQGVGELAATHAPIRWNNQAVDSLKPGQANAINPQPLPPDPPPVTRSKRNSSQLGEANMINPQPLPPKPAASLSNPQ